MSDKEEKPRAKGKSIKTSKKKTAKKKVAKKKTVRKVAKKKATATKTTKKTARKKTTARSGSARGKRISHGEYRERVALAAYYRAEKRLFENGLPEEDWLAAEREVREALEREGITIDKA